MLIGRMGFGLGLSTFKSTGVPELAATTAWVAAVVAAGGSVSTTRRGLVNTMIGGLQTDGVWTKLDRLWLHAAENAQSATIDIVAEGVATAVGAPTFTTDQGYTFASTKYLTTTFNPATAGGQYALNSAHFGGYFRTNLNNPCTTAGSFSSAGSSAHSGIDSFGGNVTHFLNDASGLNTGVASTSAGAGMWVGTRTASNATAAYKNGSSAGTGSGVSTFIPSFNLFIGARNSDGSVGNETTAQIAATCWGSGLSATDAANLSSRINTFMTAIGANIY